MDARELGGALVLFLLGAFTGFMASQPLCYQALETGRHEIQNEAVERGYGEIVVKDGVRRFQWKPEVTSGSEEQ